MITLLERYQGCLLGLAVGDALGTTVEFSSRGSFTPLTDMVGGGPFELQPGQWTDDTSMALCLAESLLFQKGFDAVDQMNRYVNWWQWGYLSSTGDCFDIGSTVMTALQKYLETKDPMAGSTKEYSSGNGSLMRLAPIPLYFRKNIKDVLHFSGESSRTTHGSVECIDACRYYSACIVTALNGGNKENILHNKLYSPTTTKVKNIAEGKYLTKSEEAIKGTGYVIDSLEASLWSFYKTDCYDDAVLAAANLGDDADTTAAITGQLAGAFYGVKAINPKWLDLLTDRKKIEEIATSLSLA